MFRRDPTDERSRQRLAGCTLASLLLHLLASAFLVSVAVASSQESAPEEIEGGQVITISQVASATAQPAPAQPEQVRPSAAPLAHQAAVIHPAYRPIRALHELTHVVPSASPNPTPVPQTTPIPQPLPTQAVAAVQPSQAPTPTLSPKPAPTASPTAAPTPKVVTTVLPTRVPTERPKAVATVVPTVAPKRTATPLKAPTTAPISTLAPRTVAQVVSPRPSLPPTERAGVPSPQPRIATATAVGRTQPGSQNAGLGKAHARPKPVSVPATPSPRPTARPQPRSTRNPYSGLNARLNAMLPHEAVHPHAYQYTGSVSLSGRLEPTPPPAVLAETKYLYDGSVGGGDRMKMWVTALQHRGPFLMCTGWMVRFPRTPGTDTLSPSIAAPANGIQIGTTRQVPSGFSAGMEPIVVGMGTMECTQRGLTPYAPGRP